MPVKLRTLFKVASVCIGSLLLLVILALAAVRSPFVLNRVLPPVQAVLEKDFNLKTKIARLSIDPFARVALEGVEAAWADPNMGQAQVQLESVLVRFSFWQLLKKRLQVSSIEVIKPRVKASLLLAEKAQNKPPQNPLALIRELLSNPPVALNLDSLTVRDLQAEVAIKQGRQSSLVTLDHLNVDADFHIVPELLSADVKLALGGPGVVENTPSKIKLTATNLSPQLPALNFESATQFFLQSRVEVSFENQANPTVRIGESKINLSMRQALLNARLDKAGAFRLTLGSADFGFSKLTQSELSLAKVFSLEKLSGEEFSKQVADKVFQSLNDFSLRSDMQGKLSQLQIAVRLPASGIESELALSFEAPLGLAFDRDGIKVVSKDQGISFQLEKIKMGGRAFAALSKSVHVEQLSGLRIETPVELQLSPASFKTLTKPLDSVRLVKMNLAPQITWGQAKEKFVESSLSFAQSLAGELTLEVKKQAKLRDFLLRLLPDLKILPETLGWIDITSLVSGKIVTGWRDLQMLLEQPNKDIRKLELKYQVNLNQVIPPKKSSELALQLPGGLQISGDADIQQPLLVKEGHVSTIVQWANEPLLTNKIHFTNTPGKLTFKGDTVAQALLRLRKITPLAEPLGMLGGTKINAQWNISLVHKAANILKAVLPAPLLMNLDVGAGISVLPVENPTMPLFEKNYLLLNGPVKARLNAQTRAGNFDTKIDFNVPRAGTPGLAVVDAIVGSLKVDSRTDLKTGVLVGVDTRIGKVVAAKSFGLPDDILPYLNIINAQIQLQTDLKTRADIRKLEATTGGGLFRVNLRGGSDLKATNSRFEGQLAVKPPKLFRYGIRAQDKVSLDGLVRVGWELTQKEQKSLRLKGLVNLDRFSAQHQLGGIKNAAGRIPFQQDLELPNFKSLRWSYLIQDNPFKRVDTSKFVPLLTDDSLLTIEELNALDKRFGPMRMRVSLQQNMLTIDKLDADIFDGVLAGQGFVDIQPSRLLAGLQGRVSKLNTSLLSSKPQKLPPAPLSARLALVVDLGKALIEGRVDVTEIGRNQLLAMIDVLDPSGADPLLNKARLALGIGYPRYVGLQMQQGFLDLDVALGGVVDNQIKIPHLPLTPIINAKTQDLVKTMREVPIQ